jgi:hypothetical protein
MLRWLCLLLVLGMSQIEARAQSGHDSAPSERSPVRSAAHSSSIVTSCAIRSRS